MSEIPLLQARNLHVFYGESHVLQGLDLALRHGESVSLLGRNGMGKTTTLRTLVGLIAPRRGSIAIDGTDVTGGPAYRVARFGVATVPEGRGIFHNLSVREHLQLAARPGPTGEQRWTLARVYELFPRLAERSGNMGPQLSGGEQQMLSIGRALMTNPRLLVLDEATEGLAPLVRKEIWAVLRRLKGFGLATLIVDKDIRALATVTDRSIVLSKGRVVYEGATQALAQSPDLLDRHLSVGAEIDAAA
jgi:branched-chain amino acid transport system ATP-binding protein